VCKGDGVDATLLVVGHCATPYITESDMRRGTCETGHNSCVILRYKDKDERRCAKIVALVDTGMSGCMRVDDTAQIHLLKLTHIGFGRTMLRKLEQKSPEAFRRVMERGRVGAHLPTRTVATSVPPVPARGTPHELRTVSFAVSRVLVDTSLAPDAAPVHVCTHGTPARRGPMGAFVACATCDEVVANWVKPTTRAAVV
jgi:hypothetical protein